jgi:hypothetical protein
MDKLIKEIEVYNNIIDLLDTVESQGWCPQLECLFGEELKNQGIDLSSNTSVVLGLEELTVKLSSGIYKTIKKKMVGNGNKYAYINDVLNARGTFTIDSRPTIVAPGEGIWSNLRDIANATTIAAGCVEALLKDNNIANDAYVKKAMDKYNQKAVFKLLFVKTENYSTMEKRTNATPASLLKHCAEVLKIANVLINPIRKLDQKTNGFTTIEVTGDKKEIKKINRAISTYIWRTVMVHALIIEQAHFICKLRLNYSE